MATPVFSSLRQDREALLRYLLLMTEALSLLGWPMAFGLALVADIMVPVVLGPAWAPAIGPMRALALAGAIRCINPLLYSVTQARGHSLFLVRFSVFGGIAIVGALLIGLHWGVVGVAAAWAVCYYVLTVPMLLHVMRDLGMSLSSYLRTLACGAGGSVVMTLAVLGTRHLVAGRLEGGRLLVVLVATGALSYLGTTALLAGARVRRIWLTLRPPRTA